MELSYRRLVSLLFYAKLCRCCFVIKKKLKLLSSKRQFLKQFIVLLYVIQYSSIQRRRVLYDKRFKTSLRFVIYSKYYNVVRNLTINNIINIVVINIKQVKLDWQISDAMKNNVHCHEAVCKDWAELTLNCHSAYSPSMF